MNFNVLLSKMSQMKNVFTYGITIYATFQKMKNCMNRKQISGCQRLEIVKGAGSFRAFLKVMEQRCMVDT